MPSIRTPRRLLATLGAAALALAFTSVSAHGQEKEKSAEKAQQSDARQVTVVLTEFLIEMPDSLPVGETTFTIRNEGQMEHGFTLEQKMEESEADSEDPPTEEHGQDVQKRSLGSYLEPGTTATLTVKLMPGTYVIWCPIADHRDRGMEFTFNVPTRSVTSAASSGR